MDDSIFAIDTLNLRLPRGFANRADAIARYVGQELSRGAIRDDVQVSKLQLPRITVHGGETNQVIARRIAQSIHRQVINANLKQGPNRGAD